MKKHHEDDSAKKIKSVLVEIEDVVSKATSIDPDLINLFFLWENECVPAESLLDEAEGFLEWISKDKEIILSFTSEACEAFVVDVMTCSEKFINPKLVIFLEFYYF